MTARTRITRRELLSRRWRRRVLAGGRVGPRLGAGTRAAGRGMSLDPGHLDPRVEAGVPGWSIFQHMFDGLVCATSGRSHSLAGHEVGAGVAAVLRWHSAQGREVPQWRGLHRGVGQSSRWSSTGRPTSRSPWKTRIGVIREYRIPDPHTIDLVTERPNRPLLRNSTSAMALSPRAFRELGDRFHESGRHRRHEVRRVPAGSARGHAGAPGLLGQEARVLADAVLGSFPRTARGWPRSRRGR